MTVNQNYIIEIKKWRNNNDRNKQADKTYPIIKIFKKVLFFC